MQLSSVRQRDKSRGGMEVGGGEGGGSRIISGLGNGLTDPAKGQRGC